MSAVKATFGGRVERINFAERSTIPGRFVFELADELTPTNVVNRLGQAVVLDQVLDAQALDANRLVLTNNAGRELLLIVTATIGNPSVETGDLAASLLTIARAFFLLGKATLCAGQFPLVACEELGVADGLP